MTNADKVRKMTDEELANVLFGFYCSDGCMIYDTPQCVIPSICTKDCLLDWLKQEAEE